MRILLDLTHPAHVHFFRHPLEDWRREGHEVLITSRRKDIAVELIERLGWEHRDLGPAKTGLGGLALEMVARTKRLHKVAREFRPDVLAAIGGTWIAPVGRLCGAPSLVFYDTENALLSNLLTYPLCTAVITPRCYEGWAPRRKHLRYAGYHELSYTHPKRFAPDQEVVRRSGLDPERGYIFLRLVSWGSSHDVHEHGIVDPREAVKRLQEHGDVVISSERRLPPDLESLRYVGDPLEVHHVLAFARLFIGESATMASESATLGTPAILVSTSRRGYTNEQDERYGLVSNFPDRKKGQLEALRKAEEILTSQNSQERWETAHRKLLNDTIDVAQFVADVVVEAAAGGRPATWRVPLPASATEGLS